MKYGIFLSATLVIWLGWFVNPLSFSLSEGSLSQSMVMEPTRLDTGAVDTIAPVALCKNIILALDAEGEARIAPSDVDNGSSDQHGIAELSIDRDDFSCGDISPFSKIVILTVEDSSGNSSSCQALVKVEDFLPPDARCKNLTVEIDDFGGIKIAASDIDDGSSDGCGIASMVIDQDSFKCSDVSAFNKVVKLSLTDANGNDSSCQALVLVVDTLAPQAFCQDVTVYLDADGTYALAASTVDAGSSDNCGLDSLQVSSSLFSCTATGSPVSVWLKVTDPQGYQDSCVAQLSVLDTLAPQVLCHPITVYLDASGSSSLAASDIVDGSSDNCGIDRLYIPPTGFDCSSTASPTDVVLTAIDIHGNKDSCSAQVIVRDSLPPLAVCQAVTVYLDASGSYTLSASEVENGSSDNCGIASISIPPSSFDCNAIPSAIYLRVTDIHANPDSCLATVSVQDSTPPDARCQPLTVYLDSDGAYNLAASSVDNASDDNCGAVPLSLTLSPASFDCGSVGNNAVNLTVSDVSGNISSCQSTITVIDSTSPAARCQNLTVQLDSMGVADILPSDIDTGSSDACGIDTRSLSKYSFDCVDLRVNSQNIFLTVTDVNNNSSLCQATVMVRDTLRPQVSCKTVVTYLDSMGQARIMASDAGSAADNCRVGNTGIDKSLFSCADLGNNTILFVAEDSATNVGSCNATVTVLDSISPEISCPADETVAADQNCQAVLADFTGKAGTLDNCTSFPAVSQSPAPGILLADTSIIILTVTDGSNNTSACTFRFIVVDDSPPVITCKNIDLALDSMGNATLTAADVTASIRDNCSSTPLLISRIDKQQFSCNELGPQQVKLTVIDVDDNQDTCIAVVTVRDNIAPAPSCPESMIFEVGGIDPYAIDPEALSRDNCAVSDVSVTPAAFSCEDVAKTIAVTLRLSDPSNNSNTCVVDVTVIDSSEAVWLSQPPRIIRCGEQLIDWDEPAARFPCDRTPLTSYNSQPAGLVKEGVFPVGITTIFYELADELVANSLTYNFDIEILPIPIITNYSNGDEFVATSLEAFEIFPEASVPDVAYLWEVQLSASLEAVPEVPAGMVSGPLVQTFNFTDPRSVGEAIYRITPVFADSCLGASVEILVKVLPGGGAFFIPDMFTPNGDGINDDWGVRLLNKGNPDDYKLQIFNQAGGLMHSAISLDSRWTGGNCPDGPYWYIIERKDTGERVKTGGITIQR